MRLRLTVDVGGRGADVLVDGEPDARVSEFARWLAAQAGRPSHGDMTVAVMRGDGPEVLRPSGTLGDSGLRSGDVVALASAASYGAQPVERTVSVRVIAGPDAGVTFDLPSGSSNIGRARENAVVLRDSLVSKVHARVNVSDSIEIVDMGSANGVVIRGEPVSRIVLGPDDEVLIGDSTLVFTRVGAGTVGGSIPFVRSPWLDPRYEGVDLVAPEPPVPPRPAPFPKAMLLMPIVMAGVLYAATRNVASLAFVAMTPLMMIAAWFENRGTARRAYEDELGIFRSSLADLVVQMQRAFEDERSVRAHEHPASSEAVEAAGGRAPLLWSRRADRPGFLELRLGLGTQKSRSTIEAPKARRTTPGLWAELTDVVGRFTMVDRVPVIAPLAECGGVGVAGPDPMGRDAARSLVAQLVALHSPAEVVLAAIIPTSRLGDWSWLKWLPHVDSSFSPIEGQHLASSGPTCDALLAQIESLIAERSAEDNKAASSHGVDIVLLVESEPPADWARIVRVAESGRSVGVATIWVGDSIAALPAVCGRFLTVSSSAGAHGIGVIEDGSFVTPVEVELLSVVDADRFARELAPVSDAGARLADEGELPSAVSFAAEQGLDLLDASDAVIERWRQSQSIGVAPTEGNSRRDRTLRAYVGSAAGGPMMLDLRAHGPHALVGGTTGAGKSEFLQTWIAGMATSHSPERVNFLLVDYKGGSAFGPCSKLPHSVGLVTDLNTRLVRRVLESLKAELIRREHLLNEWSAKDLVDLESKEAEGAPIVPSLVIVVDEFAALMTEIPEFVDGMIDVAQRGRSLGLHLILATQRPQGVITGNLRANTNLRVALRMADADDSLDVVGSTVAADFLPSLPGRAVARLGPGKPIAFQTAYVGGHTSGEPPPPRLLVSSLPLGVGEAWEAPPAAAPAARAVGPKDLHRIVGNVGSAAVEAGIAAPRRPWLDELAARYELDKMPTRRLDSELVFGVADRPAQQAQREIAFAPDTDGNLAIFGTGGAGKSTLLRTLAIAAGLAHRGGPTAVYGLDFGASGLAMLQPLPHVGSIVSGDDHERVSRLIRQLRELIDERSGRYAAIGAGSIDEYRRIAARPDEVRVFLLLDNAGAFRAEYEVGHNGAVFDSFQTIASAGRGLGVHVILTADRPNSVPSSLMSMIPSRIAMRLADEVDLGILGVPGDAFDADSPSGRAYFGGDEVQVAVLGGADASVASQVAAIEMLAGSMRRAGTVPAPPIERLPAHVRLDELPVAVDGLPVIGLADDSLGPFGLHPGDSFVVCGPPRSGRTTALLTIVEAIRRWHPATEFFYFGNRRSPVGAQHFWSRQATTPDEAAELAEAMLATMEESQDAAGQVIVIEAIGDFIQGSAELVLQDLIKAARVAGATVISEGETAVIGSSWPLFKEARATRHGIVLQPDQMDGDTLFGTPFGRMSRAEFPEGRGMYVRSARASRIQLATPD
ncbi:MAG: FtsK/SpoIIIE domain-containing protein [Microthrixaceae bacterium]